eukprot:evm.model.scf_147.3 EVM.evm.TU.scf_147.3   scf_147:24955-28270(-)
MEEARHWLPAAAAAALLLTVWGAAGVEVRNWGGDIATNCAEFVTVRSADDIVEVVRDGESYPAPVRALGSRHSNTKVIMADGGTVVNMRKMNAILGHDESKLTVTVEAGALYIDVSEYLQKHGLMHYVNTEFGSISSGAAAVAHTKDAAFVGEHGQISSYVVGVKIVTADGDKMTIDEDNHPELLRAVRSSYGLLGIVYEVTFRVRPLELIMLWHRTYTLDDFLSKLDDIRSSGTSVMIYYYPYEDKMTVEFRAYHNNPAVNASEPNFLLSGRPLSWWASLQFRVRNGFWGGVGPVFGRFINQMAAAPEWLTNGMASAFSAFLGLAGPFMSGGINYPPAQMHRYPDDTPQGQKIAFSLFSFPAHTFPDALRAYYAFCQDHLRRTGWRTSLPHVGYRLYRDHSSLLSHSTEDESLSFDPVTVPDEGWYSFLEEYNEFCARWRGTPLLNQTPHLKARHVQAKEAYGKALPQFREVRRRMDPQGRFLTPHLRDLLGL